MSAGDAPLLLSWGARCYATRLDIPLPDSRAEGARSCTPIAGLQLLLGRRNITLPAPAASLPCSPVVGCGSSHRTPCLRLVHRRALAATCTPPLPQERTLPCVQPRLHRRKVRRWCGTAYLPTAPAVGGDLCPPDLSYASRSMLVFIPTSSSRARPCSNILARRSPSSFHMRLSVPTVSLECSYAPGVLPRLLCSLPIED